MRCAILHTTEYTYSLPVHLDTHVVRLRPRTDGGQSLRQFDYEVKPEPTLSSFCLDLDGNVVLNLWFREVCQKLEIRFRSEVDTSRSNPFDYLPEPGADQLPLQLSAEHRNLFKEYLARQTPSDHRHNGIGQLARTLARSAEHQLVVFLAQLTQYIHHTIRVVYRPHGGPQQPGDTLFTREGACRDLAVLFIDVCRQLGVPARFVSGYCFNDPLPDLVHLHAWAEVYVPGGGWRGFDPSLGLAVADRHVAVAAGSSPAAALPVTGSFRSSTAVSSLRYHIALEEL